MAPKPKSKPARFVFAVAMALTILAVMTWEMAAPSSPIYPIYQPQLLLLYLVHRHARACAPILSVGSGAHSHDHTGDRTGGRDLGAGPHRMSCSHLILRSCSEVSQCGKFVLGANVTE